MNSHNQNLLIKKLRDMLLKTIIHLICRTVFSVFMLLITHQYLIDARAFPGRCLKYGETQVPSFRKYPRTKTDLWDEMAGGCLKDLVPYLLLGALLKFGTTYVPIDNLSISPRCSGFSRRTPEVWRNVGAILSEISSNENGFVG